MTKTKLVSESKSSKARTEKALASLIELDQVETVQFKGGANGRTVKVYVVTS